MSRPVWGAWIEMAILAGDRFAHRGRAPYGARGLKSSRCISSDNGRMSRPVWGAWIEILVVQNPAPVVRSRPVWGAWIEIPLVQTNADTKIVAPRMGRVD